MPAQREGPIGKGLGDSLLVGKLLPVADLVHPTLNSENAEGAASSEDPLNTDCGLQGGPVTIEYGYVPSGHGQACRRVAPE